MMVQIYNKMMKWQIILQVLSSFVLKCKKVREKFGGLKEYAYFCSRNVILK